MNKKRWLVIVVIVTAAIALAILFDTMLANHRPAITSLEAPEWVIPSESYQIVCTASDRDGDELSYNWSASRGKISGEGATANWTAPLYLGSCDITVTVTDGRGGEIMSQVTITVKANRSPTIASLIADADWTTPSGSLQVTCNASDPDGDELSYEWSTTGGNTSGIGTVVNWTAPEEVGIYHITVVVKDSQGDKATRSVTLSVARDTPPIIENLIVTAKGHQYLRKSMFGYDYDVWKTNEYNIECIVSDTNGGVFYVWSCDDGEISGEGSTITWTAPDKPSLQVKVTVIVSDAVGNKVSKSIYFYVPYCACGQWG